MTAFSTFYECIKFEFLIFLLFGQEFFYFSGFFARFHTPASPVFFSAFSIQNPMLDVRCSMFIPHAAAVLTQRHRGFLLLFFALFAPLREKED